MEKLPKVSKWWGKVCIILWSQNQVVTQGEGPEEDTAAMILEKKMGSPLWGAKEPLL